MKKPTVSSDLRDVETTPIAHVRVYPMTMNLDHRGHFTEVFRNIWTTGIQPVQWNFVRSRANVLRGVHVHKRHADYLIIVQGHATIGLSDLRPGSPTKHTAYTIEANGDRLEAIVIPPGVAHGFYFHEDSMHLYAVSHYWDEADELGCHWADPELGIDWPTDKPILSEKDASLGMYQMLLGQMPPYQP